MRRLFSLLLSLLMLVTSLPALAETPAHVKKMIAELREETELDYMFKQLLFGTVIGVVLIALIGACSAIGDYLEVAL